MHDVELSVIAPCFNEEQNVPLLVSRMRATFAHMGIRGELVLVDDGSRDATWERIAAAQAAYPDVRGVHHEKNQGIEGGWKSGLAAAGGALVCLIDSDLQNRPEDVALLWATYREGTADIVQAVRQPQGVERRRLVFSRTLNTLLNASFGMRLRDSKSGFLMCHRDVLRSLLDHRYHYRYFQSFVGVAAGARGLRVAEVDTTFEPRRAGESFLAGVPVRVVARIVWELGKYRLETLTDARHRPGMGVRTRDAGDTGDARGGAGS